MTSQNNPEFILWVGPMWSTKSTSLLLQIEKYELQNKKIHIYKPLIDKRYDNNKVTTHNGWNKPAIQIESGLDILNHIEKTEIPDVVAIDEAFMIPEIAKTLIWLFQKGTTILVSSIELSYAGKPFKEITHMFPWATQVYKCVAVCSVCKKENAHYTYRKSNDVSDIVVGGKDIYEARCWHCHPKIDQKPGDFQ